MYRKVFIDEYLKHGFDLEEAKAEVNFACEILFNYKYKDFILDKKLEKRQINGLKKIISERIQTHRPISQIIGQSFFYGRRFFVNEHTLIPRSETEILVSKVLELAKEFHNPKILEIGTGSGCIALTLILENPDTEVHAIDISEYALETAKKNAILHNISSNINFFKSDIYENVTDKYNIIVSNPPYIPLKDKETLQIEVRDFEPALALFAGDEAGIEFYKKIIDKAANYLHNGGYIALEHGINQAGKISNLLKEQKFSWIKQIKDFNNIERIILSKK